MLKKQILQATIPSHKLDVFEGRLMLFCEIVFTLPHYDTDKYLCNESKVSVFVVNVARHISTSRLILGVNIHCS